MSAKNFRRGTAKPSRHFDLARENVENVKTTKSNRRKLSKNRGQYVKTNDVQTNRIIKLAI